MPRSFLPNLTVDGSGQNWQNDFASPPVTQFRPRNRNAQVGDVYEANVIEVLQRISQNSVGSLLLQDILAQTERVRILPQITPRSVTPDFPNRYRASAVPANPRDAALGGVRIFGVSGRPAAFIGTGRGTDVSVRFTPWHWPVREAPPGLHRDETLFHELFHAARIMRGLLLQRPMTGSDIFHRNSDEWYAVMLTNVFISACPEPRPLRAESSGAMIMTTEAQRLFLERCVNPQDRWFELIAGIYQDMPTLARGVGEVRCAFNPLQTWRERGTREHSAIRHGRQR